MAKLKNHEIKESGKYVMSRTDDDTHEGRPNLVDVVEYKGEFYLPDLETPISHFDEECRWEKYVEPPKPATKKETGLSRHWVLNQLSGMKFHNGVSDAYDYMKRCIEASDKADEEG